MRLILFTSVLLLGLISPHPVFAETTTPDLTTFTHDTVGTLTLIASLAASLFLIKGGYLYIISTGKPDKLDEAKRTIRNALLGLVLTLAAHTVVSIFTAALVSPDIVQTSVLPEVLNVELVEPDNSFVTVMVETVTGFLRVLLKSSVKPIVDSVLSNLTSTPSVLNNAAIYKIWLVSVGVVDSLFVIVVGLLGLQMMSASTFGFDEVDFHQLLPRVGLAFIGANISLYLVDYVILTCNVLIKAVLDNTGGLSHAWITDATNPLVVFTNSSSLTILLFLTLFLVVSIVLWLMYISRLIIVALGAVLSPFIFLLWLIPKFSDYAVLAAKTYITTIFIIFVHVVVIQVASAFLTLPEHDSNPLTSIAVAIGLFFTLIKIPNMMTQMVLFTTGNGSMKKLGSQVINVMTTKDSNTQPIEKEGGFRRKRKETDI